MAMNTDQGNDDCILLYAVVIMQIWNILLSVLNLNVLKVLENISENIEIIDIITIISYKQ